MEKGIGLFPVENVHDTEIACFPAIGDIAEQPATGPASSFALVA